MFLNMDFTAIAIYQPQDVRPILKAYAGKNIPVEYAKKAVGDNGKGEVEERVGEIIRFLPMHLLHKSLDGIFREWKTDKKSGR